MADWFLPTLPSSSFSGRAHFLALRRSAAAAAIAAAVWLALLWSPGGAPADETRAEPLAPRAARIIGLYDLRAPGSLRLPAPSAF